MLSYKPLSGEVHLYFLDISKAEYFQKIVGSQEGTKSLKENICRVIKRKEQTEYLKTVENCYMFPL